MDILEMTDLEIYELGINELIEQIGPTYTERFLRQCKPREYDYTAERHKVLANQPDIHTIAKRIQRGEVERKEEERIKAERVAAWRKGILELTDIEIYELVVKILADKLHVYGSVGFFQQHFKNLNGDQSTDTSQHLPDSDVNVLSSQQLQESEPQD